MRKKREIHAGDVCGQWTVLTPDAGSDPPRWLCRCACGTEKSVLERSLIYGQSRSCGCLKLRRAAEKNRHDLLGRVFGELTVLERLPDAPGQRGVSWRCRCSCGREINFLGTLLVTGRRSHCGCKSIPNYAYQDIAGQRIGRLTALWPLPERDSRGNVIWQCRCDCGAEPCISYNQLIHTRVESCGCLHREQAQNLYRHLDLVDGTMLDSFRSTALRTDNTTGVKGVYRKNGRYMAKIVFQKKQYYLGCYRDLEEAAQARADAEKQLQADIFPAYEKWKARADADPDWAEAHPVRLICEKDGVTGIRVSFLPDMERD